LLFVFDYFYVWFWFVLGFFTEQTIL
jgi:hypothetical protein